MDSRLQRGFRVGEYIIRPLEGRIVGPRGEQHAQPKVMEILLCLAEQPGELVGRDALIERGWGEAGASGDALTRCISELRHHFDDHRETVRYIQTIPKRGYRLIADVRAHDTESEDAAAGVEPLGDEPTANSEPTGVIAFWNDLKRRNVVRVGVAYLVVAWLLMQVGEMLFQALQLPDWALTLLLALLMLGFPVALIMAWAFQVTPEGVLLDIRRTPRSGKTALRHNLDVVIIGALVITVGILGYRAFIADEPARGEQPRVAALPIQSPENSIAVLRFLNLGGEPHFADGLAEELLDRLANLSELGVAARTSSWAFSGSDADVPTIARQLDVNYVLEGSIRQSGDQIRVTAQLNDGGTGKHVWSQSYDRRLTADTFFETQSDIARQVVSLLKVSLSPESEDRLSAKPQTTMEALEFYLQGQEYFRKPHSDETLDTAARLFRRALEIDPRFAMAYAGLCNTELGRYIITREVATFAQAERACHRALTLDDDLPRVLAALGGLYLFSGQDEKAEEELRRAIGESPNLIDAYADLGEALENQGRMEEAEQVFQTMVTRQPGYWYSHNALGNFYYRQSRFDDAARAWSTVTGIAPDRALGFNNLATAYYMLGDFAAASSAYEKSVQIEPYVDNYSNLGLAYYYDGRYADAAEMQRKALALRPADAHVLGRLATAYQYMGREDEARTLYRDAIELIREQLVINPNDIRLNRYLAVFSANIGQIQEAQEAIARALELQPDSSGVRYDAAKISLTAGDQGAALDYLEQAKELGYSTSIIRADPAFAVLHGDQRFVLVAQENNNGRE